ncbi:MAG: VWA-like domain-containing protein [Lachnospiraceae bacterium]|nr:VWA-like domain-containing protein [Lachnospiraceae bacterium]
MRKDSNKEKLEKLGRDILENSKKDIYLSLRFFASALEGLTLSMRQDVASLGTDGVSLFYRTPALSLMYEENPVLVNRAYLHILLHCLLYHPFKPLRSKDEELWNISCEIAVEALIDSLDLKAFKLLVSDYRKEIYKELNEELPVLTAEGIYKVLSGKEISFAEREALLKEFARDDHGLWKKAREENEKKNSGDESLPPSWEKLNRRVLAGMDVYLRKMGDKGGNLLSALKFEGRKRDDLTEFLSRFTIIREETRLSDEEFDLNFYTYGLKLYKNMPLVEPLETRESKKIRRLAIVVDTSGSCSGEAIKSFLEKTYSVILNEESFFTAFNVHIIQADAAVTKETLIRSKEEFAAFSENFEVAGNGGTDFRPAIDYVTKKYEAGEMPELCGLLYFTDGIGIYPKKSPPYKTAFVFIKKLGDPTGLPVPAWAERLVLDEMEAI